MSLPKRKVEQSLSAKGFEVDESDHHRFVYYTTKGKLTTIRTKTSHSKKMKDIGDPLVGAMAKQVRLTRDQFVNLINCPLSRREYERLLLTAGLLAKSDVDLG